jgi:hypothetical protein
MRPDRRAMRGAALALVAVLAIASCQDTARSTPAASADAGTPSGPQPSADGGLLPDDATGLPIVELADSDDPLAVAGQERDLVDQVRDDGGMAAFIGPKGQAALDALDEMQAEYAQRVLEAAATAAETGEFPAGASLDPLAGLVASLGGVEPGDRDPPDPAIDISLYADTGFTTSAVLGLLTTVIQRAAESGAGTLPRQESKDQTDDGLRQQVDLNTTISFQTGQGRVVADVTMAATDRISDTTGSFVGLYTSRSTGHFDVSACPNAQGIAEGTYTFETKHELNDVSGAANRQSGAGRSVSAPFKLVNGPDAKLVRIEANLDLKADARGPGTPGGPGQTGPFDWAAGQQVGIVIPASGGSQWSGGRPQITGTGGEQAGGATFITAAMAALFMGEVGKEAERFWRSGKCIELTPSRDSGTVRANEQVDLTVEAKEKFGGGRIDEPIEATFSGKESLDPVGRAVKPAAFTFKAGSQRDDTGIIDLKQTSVRGIGLKHLEFKVEDRMAIQMSGRLREPGARLELDVKRTPLPASDRGFEAVANGRVTGRVDVFGCDKSVSEAISFRVIAAPDETDPELFHLFVTPTSMGLDPEKEITCQGVTTRAPVPVSDFGLPFLGTDGSVPVRVNQPTRLSDPAFPEVQVTVTLSQAASTP